MASEPIIVINETRLFEIELVCRLEEHAFVISVFVINILTLAPSAPGEPAGPVGPGGPCQSNQLIKCSLFYSLNFSFLFH